MTSVLHVVEMAAWSAVMVALGLSISSAMTPLLTPTMTRNGFAMIAPLSVIPAKLVNTAARSAT